MISAKRYAAYLQDTIVVQDFIVVFHIFARLFPLPASNEERTQCDFASSLRAPF